MAVKSLSIRIDEQLLNKLHVVANYEGRSANSQILVLIRESVKQFESEHGAIDGPLSSDVNVRPTRKS